MSALILNGNAVAKKMRDEMKAQIAASGRKPGLAVVLVGEDPASQVYVRNKGRAAEEVGMQSWTHRLPAETTQRELLGIIDELNHNPEVHGILVQLPVPKHIDAEAVINAIDPAKDVDGFHPVNVGRLYTGMPYLVPCTPQGSMILLREALPDVKGMKAVVVGRSNIVGKPVAQLLLQADCTVTITHSRTRNLGDEIRAADIVVAAIGKPEFVQGDWIKAGAVVIDVGINRVAIGDGVPPALAERTISAITPSPPKSKLVGDVAFAAAAERASAITPVPGGVGPMTIACLLKNTLQAAGII